MSGSTASRWLARFVIGSAFRIVRAALVLFTVATLCFFVLLTAYNSRLDVPLHVAVSSAARFDFKAAILAIDPYALPVAVIALALVLAYSAYRAGRPNAGVRRSAEVSRTMLIYTGVPVVIAAISWLFPIARTAGASRGELVLLTLLSYAPVSIPIVAATLLGRGQDVLTDRFLEPKRTR